MFPRPLLVVASLALVPAFLGFLAVADAGPRQGPATPVATPPAAPSGPRVVLEGASGAPVVRALDGFTCADPRTLGAHLVRFEGLATPASGASAERADVRLTTGERLVGRVRRGAGEMLDVELAGGVHATAELEHLASVLFAGRVPRDGNTPLEPAKEGDRLYRLRNDTVERIDGGVEEFGAEGLKFHNDKVGSLSIAWSEVVALFVETTGRLPEARGEGVRVEVDLVDTTRLVGRLMGLDARGVTLKRIGGEELALPPAVVALVFVDDGRLSFLSDLAPIEPEPARPFGDDLGMTWPHRVDASVVGTPLAVGGRTFSRGFGVHAPQRLRFALDGGVTALRGAVGVDDSVLSLAAHGSVRFRVRVDGVVRFESPVLSGGSGPVAIVLDPPSLAGARELVLEADPADDSFVADRADWLQLLVVR